MCTRERFRGGENVFWVAMATKYAIPSQPQCCDVINPLMDRGGALYVLYCMSVLGLPPKGGRPPSLLGAGSASPMHTFSVKLYNLFFVTFLQSPPSPLSPKGGSLLRGLIKPFCCKLIPGGFVPPPPHPATRKHIST